MAPERGELGALTEGEELNEGAESLETEGFATKKFDEAGEPESADDEIAAPAITEDEAAAPEATAPAAVDDEALAAATVDETPTLADVG